MIRSRYIVPAFLLALSLGATVLPSSTAAQATSCPTGEVLDSGTGLCWPADSAQGIVAAQQNASNQQAQTQTQTQLNNLESSGNVNGADTAAQKSPTTLNDGPISQTNQTMDWVMAELMSLFAWLLGIAAITLDNAMYYTVVHMGSYVNGLSAVGVAWRILRDIGNIVLIFGFVALGITVILDVKWYGGGTKMLPVLLIAALFLNFSLFAAEAVIDVGNLFATEFYTQINGGAPSAPVDYSSTSVSNEGISNAVMNQLGLQAFYNAGVAQGDNGSNVSSIFQNGHPFIIGFMAILIFLIASFVFFSLAFILIARFVVLVLLIIIAPIGFAGLAVPKLEGQATRWWSTLFSQTITAPVMLLMLYVALAVITDAQFLTGFGVGGSGSGASNVAQNAWLGAVTSATGTNIGGLASVLLSFLVAMGLLLAVTMLSKSLGAIGGQWATKTAGAMTFGATRYAAKYGAGRAGALAAGTAGFAGRRTLGRGFNAAAERWKTSSLGRKAFIGRIGGSVLDAGAKASYDVRGTKIAQTAAKSAGLDIGTAQKGGYAGTVKESVKKKVDYSKGLGLTPAEEAKKKALQDKLDEAARIRDRGLDALPASDTTGRKKIKDTYKEFEESIKRTTFEADGKTIKDKGLDYYNNRAQQEYAANLKRPFPQPIQAIYRVVTASGPRADNKAAKEILAKATKGQAAQLKDALDDFGKAAAKDGSH